MDAPINVRIDYREVFDALARLRRAASDFTPANKLVGIFAAGAVQGNFERQSTPSGTPWDHLKRPRRRNVAASKAKARKLARMGAAAIDGIATQILVDTGALVGGIHYDAFPTRVVISTSEQTRAYAAAQNFGFPSRNLPAREFMGLREEDQVEVADIYDRYLQQLSDTAMGNA